MKLFLSLLLSLACSLPLFAQLPVSVRTTNGTSKFQQLNNSTNHGTFTIDQAGAGLAWSFQTNWFVGTNGQIGIGTANPNKTLDIVASSGNAIVSLFPAVTVNAAWLEMHNALGYFYLGVDNSTGTSFGGAPYANVFYGAANYPTEFFTDNVERMRILGTGNIGIGTATPAQTLSVNGTAGISNGIVVGPGTLVTNIVSATSALDFGNILAAASADLTITVQGAKANDGVFLGLPTAPNASLVFNAFVSSANTVTVRAYNVGAIAVDQASLTFRVVVNQF